MDNRTLTPCPKCHKLNRVPVDGGKTPVCGACKSELQTHGAISEVSAASLSTLVQKSPLPVVVDFWAPWCGPCRAFAPTFEQVGRELAGQVVFAKLNTEAQPSAGAEYSIRSIPTLIFFQGGQERNRQSGAFPAQALRDWIKQHARSSAA